MPSDVRFSGKNVPNSIFAGAPPQTPSGSLQRSPDLLAVLKGLTSKRRGRRRRSEGKGIIREKGEGMEKEEREGEGPTRLISTAFADQISYPLKTA